MRSNKQKSGNRHSTNSRRHDRKYGRGPHPWPAKAGKKARFTVPSRPNMAIRKARVSGEQQFFHHTVPLALREEFKLASGVVAVKFTPIVGVWDENRKRFIRHPSKWFT